MKVYVCYGESEHGFNTVIYGVFSNYSDANEFCKEQTLADFNTSTSYAFEEHELDEFIFGKEENTR